MLNLFKKLFAKEETSAPSTPVAPPPSAPATPASRTQPAAPAPTAPAAPAAPATSGADGIKISLKNIIPAIPDSAKPKMVREVLPTDFISLPRGEVMTQLATGAVKITFIDLCRRAPGVFAEPDAELASKMVNLPLPEILSQVKQLPRRQNQKVVEIPSDLQQVFGPGSAQRAPVSPAPSAPEPPRASATTAPAPAPAPAASPARPPTPPVPAPPPPKPVPPPPAPPAPAAASEQAYVPPSPKPLPQQESIKFSLPGQSPAPAPTPAPAPPPPPPTPVAAPLPVRPTVPPPAASPADGPVIAFGDIFGQPEKTDWSAQEVADKAAGLRGVAGAVITTADGLPVAFRLPDNLSGNLVAAFVPQMFTRIVQYTRDLKLGEARHLTIFIENTPLQIFKTGSVYFTVLGKAGENLPKPQLTAIASALGRQNP